MTLTPQLIEDYLRRLAEDERGAATIDKYRRDLLRFYKFLPQDKVLDKGAVLNWKEHLVAGKYASSSVNVMLASVNDLLVGLPYICDKEQKRMLRYFKFCVECVQTYNKFGIHQPFYPRKG